MSITIMALVLIGAFLLYFSKRFVKRIVLEVERLTTQKKRVRTDNLSEIFIAKNGTPQENVCKALKMMGGIECFIGINDIVIIKPNLQWWNQGRTNLAAMKGFIDLIISIDGFKGEIIIAENHHFMDSSLTERERDNIRGWTHFSEINGDIDGINHNVNTLVEIYHKLGHKNVTKCHWRDGGSKRGGWGNGQNGGIIRSPADGDGYIWSDIDYAFTGYMGLKKWTVKMSYPIFTSAHSGITIDFKYGAFLRDGKGSGKYLPEIPVKLINFPAICSHGNGWDTGTTSAIKNYMGVTDMSCGYWGYDPKGYYNVHDCGGEGAYPYAKAGPLGHFMKTIRRADLNIVTAEWVGWGDRIDPNKAVRMRCILAGRDPVALDYYSAKYLVYPYSREKNFHDPDYPRSRVRQFLNLAQTSLGGGAVDEGKIITHIFDFKQRTTDKKPS